MRNDPVPNKNAAKEFLLKEYDYFTESFHKNEEVGEKRVDFFTGFVTAVIGGLIALINSDKGISGEPLRFVIIAGMFSLLMIGLITLLRLLKRNKVTDEFKDKLDNIRKLLKKHYGPNSALSEYSPFEKESNAQKTDQEQTQENNQEGPENKITLKNLGCIKFIACVLAQYSLLKNYGKKIEEAGMQPEKKIKEFIVNEEIRSFGGLVDFVTAINALICMGIFVAIVYPIPKCIASARFYIDKTDIVIITIGALVTFLIVFVWQYNYIAYKHLTLAFKIKKPWKHTNSD